MSKRYNKSESRKGKSYNKSRRRRPHPPYHESRPRERRQTTSTQALEMERGDALDFDLKVPKVDWEIPTIGDIETGGLTDTPEAQKTKPNDPLELPESEIKPKQPSQPQVKVAPKTQAPQSLGQKPKPLTRQQQIQREIQRRQAAQQQQQMQRNTQVHPAAIMGPLVVMFIIMAFLSTMGVPPIVYLIVLFFFGRYVWNIIQGGEQK